MKNNHLHIKKEKPHYAKKHLTFSVLVIVLAVIIVYGLINQILIGNFFGEAISAFVIRVVFMFFVVGFIAVLLEMDDKKSKEIINDMRDL